MKIVTLFPQSQLNLYLSPSDVSLRIEVGGGAQDPVIFNIDDVLIHVILSSSSSPKHPLLHTHTYDTLTSLQNSQKRTFVCTIEEKKRDQEEPPHFDHPQTKKGKVREKTSKIEPKFCIDNATLRHL